MSRLQVPRMIATGSVVSAATAVRVGVGCAELCVERAPALINLAVRASAGRVASPRAQAAFRDQLIALARESAEVSWRELRRGVDDLDEFTRPHEKHLERAPRRPYRVKP